MHLLTDSDFCKGVVVTNPLITVDEHSFFSTSNTEPKVEKEVNKTDFPKPRESMIKILDHHRETIAVEGDKLGRTDAIQHTTLLEEGARPFFIPNYRLPISMRPIVHKLIEEMKADGVVVPSIQFSPNRGELLVPKKDGRWRLSNRLS